MGCNRPALPEACEPKRIGSSEEDPIIPTKDVSVRVLLFSLTAITRTFTIVTSTHISATSPCTCSSVVHVAVFIMYECKGSGKMVFIRRVQLWVSPG